MRTISKHSHKTPRKVERLQSAAQFRTRIRIARRIDRKRGRGA
jgi:hypothetical protein